MTDSRLFIPAAQYLRMSTEHQQYSWQNQSAAIGFYAETHGFEIVKTYSDARTGVTIRHRPGLKSMLQEVVSGSAPYRAILVYDVSRWGRFQDTDESAHYEFICKQAGVPVHYCCEMFANDGTLTSLIMKALKRTMAGEYSRELGVKVFQGQSRLAALGFKQGGLPGYGLRRMLVAPDGRVKQQLKHGERKSIATDRVILIPGPANELAVVRRIFRLLVIDRLPVYRIARRLNEEGIPYLNGAKWSHHAVQAVLTHPKYVGDNVFGRTSCRLQTSTVRKKPSEWVIAHGAFAPIVESRVFESAQRMLGDRTIRKSDRDLLDKLRSLLRKEGRLSIELIQDSPDTPSPSTYRHRFGSMRRAYALVGHYGEPRHFERIDFRRRLLQLREELMRRIVDMFPQRLSLTSKGGRWRTLLLLDGHTPMSVVSARAVRVWKDTIRWLVKPVPDECALPTILARFNVSNTAYQDFFVFRGSIVNAAFFCTRMMSGSGMESTSN